MRAAAMARTGADPLLFLRSARVTPPTDKTVAERASAATAVTLSAGPARRPKWPERGLRGQIARNASASSSQAPSLKEVPELTQSLAAAPIVAAATCDGLGRQLPRRIEKPAPFAGSPAVWIGLQGMGPHWIAVRFRARTHPPALDRTPVDIATALLD